MKFPKKVIANSSSEKITQALAMNQNCSFDDASGVFSSEEACRGEETKGVLYKG